MASSKRIALDITPDQEAHIRKLYADQGWEYAPGSVPCCDHVCHNEGNNGHDEGNDLDHPAPQEPGPALPHNREGLECPHCYCTPCVTSDQFAQQWWPAERPPHNKNHGARKAIYKRFWGFMANLGLWKDQRYMRRKQQILTQDPRCRTYAWVRSVSKREVMPNCVLKFVRSRLPSPNNHYMEHMWE